MDWIDVAKLVAPLAPTLGGILGGFIPVPGASIAGQAVGSVIARAFGVEATPNAVAAAVGATPNDIAIAKLRAAADEARAQWPAIAKIEEAIANANAEVAGSINQTMRAELEHESLFFTGWRPAAGWLFDIFSAVYGSMLTWAIYQAGMNGNDKLLTSITAAWPVLSIFLGSLAAMVGVYVIGRTQEKVAITAAPPPVVVNNAQPARPPAPAVRR